MVKKEKKIENREKILSVISTMLHGSFLKKAKNGDNILFLFFLTFLGILYIGNSFLVDSTVRKTNAVNKELQELHTIYITTKSDWIYKSKPSVIAKSLEKNGIKQSTSPPYKLKFNSMERDKN
ncbi:MAG: FtsL-like putative cell division protein [Bacteroidales bacterium]